MSTVKCQNVGDLRRCPPWSGGDLCQKGGDSLNVHREVSKLSGGDLRRRGWDLLNVHRQLLWIYIEEVGIY